MQNYSFNSSFTFSVFSNKVSHCLSWHEKGHNGFVVVVVVFDLTHWFRYFTPHVGFHEINVLFLTHVGDNKKRKEKRIITFYGEQNIYFKRGSRGGNENHISLKCCCAETLLKYVKWESKWTASCNNFHSSTSHLYCKRQSFHIV